MTFALGTLTPPIHGDITQLHAIILANPRAIEANLGYGAGRLAAGYKIVLLPTLPTPYQFELSGTTLRSGGRLGAPADTPEADTLRKRVHDDILEERSEAGYSALQEAALRNMQVTGPKRLVKILPDTRHDEDARPKDQYPIGGGFLQWNLKEPGIRCIYAARVDGDGITHVAPSAGFPESSFALNTGNFSQDYPKRARLQKYLQTLTV